ncbi:uncharacterized acetyltransferase At3g50280-like [Cornus florida]|uniref:uncharacterized acetyltransferase At3g50280-like n=1 Tax=Cornus florida TaxID=4283 RepID=UPI00289C61B5|nr:uncharacterized acetyltransferase At3g50280-like [Cornus florida]
MNAPTVQHITECFIKPQNTADESKQPIHLSQWELAMLSLHYIQKGLLFVKSRAEPIKPLLERLKVSLSLALVHFYPLAGRLSTLKQENPPCYSVFIDCNDSPGAKFIHAAVDLTMSDVLSPSDVPLVVQSFFDHDRAINHDGHTMSLLSIQVTELVDGIFIGCSMNHAVADGTSFWHFFRVWSEIFKAQGQDNIPISHPPIHKRWFPEDHGPIISLPFTHDDQFIKRHEAPQLRERIFHFSTEAIARIKAKANSECNSNNISSLQALSALLWRSVTRGGRPPADKETSCRMSINNRSRLSPPLPQEYFGNPMQTVRGSTTAGDLLEHDLGWAASLLHQAVTNHNDNAIREWGEAWLQSPFICQQGRFLDPCSILMGSSPRFDMYGNEFGLGKAVALRSGYANKFDGKVSLYPGYEGGGSMDLEVCLSPDLMCALESDKEFMEAIL